MAYITKVIEIPGFDKDTNMIHHDSDEVCHAAAYKAGFDGKSKCIKVNKGLETDFGSSNTLFQVKCYRDWEIDTNPGIIVSRNYEPRKGFMEPTNYYLVRIDIGQVNPDILKDVAEEVIRVKP